MLELKLSSEAEANLRQQAALAGQDVDSFVLQALAEKLADADSQSSHPADCKGWVERLQACVALHPIVTHFVDDSRESIYASRGE